MHIYYRCRTAENAFPAAQENEKLDVPVSSNIPNSDITNGPSNPNGKPDLEGIIKEDRVEKKTAEETKAYETTESPKPLQIPSSTVETLSRRVFPKPSRYNLVKDLEKAKSQTGDWREKAAINRHIHFLRENYPEVAKAEEKKDFSGIVAVFQDLNGKTIGEMHRTHKDKEGHPGYVLLGDSSIIGGGSFDFNYSTVAGYALRSTLYLTQDGREGLERYIKKYLKRKDLNFSGRRRSSNIEIRRRLERQGAYNLEVLGTNTHVHLRGKIEIFTSLPKDLSIDLADSPGLNFIQRKRFKTFTAYSPLKRWITYTNNDFNVFVGKTFGTLSQVASEIYS